MRRIYEGGSDGDFRSDSEGNENPDFVEQMDEVYYRLTGKRPEDYRAFYSEVSDA